MMAMDIKNFYLGTPMKDLEFLKIQLSDIPQEIITHYKLKQFADNKNWVYFQINRGMYGLPQASILANKQLERIIHIIIIQSLHLHIFHLLYSLFLIT